jgi:hypothetical protein
MELYNDIQIEVSQIAMFDKDVTSLRKKYIFKRLIFIADIADIQEYAYLTEDKHKYLKCRAITLKDGRWFKVTDSYEELKSLMVTWYTQPPLAE